jgi:hypothetical protein
MYKHDKNHVNNSKKLCTFVKNTCNMKKYTLEQLILYYGDLKVRQTLNLINGNKAVNYIIRTDNVFKIICKMIKTKYVDI